MVSDRGSVPSLLCRNLVSTESILNGDRISVAQYNILADAAIPRDNTGSDVCGFYKFCPAEYRYMKYRHEQILQELRCLNADIVTIQEIEVEHFYDSLKQEMESLGYCAVIHARFFDHIGMAIFYKHEKLKLKMDSQFIIHKRLGHHLMDQAGMDKTTSDGLVDHLITSSTSTGIVHPPGCIIANFELSTSGQSFWVATTHITWKKMRYPSMQILQAYTVLKELHRYASGQPMILSADFNAEPNSPVYEMLSSGQINERAMGSMLSNPYFLDATTNINNMKITDLLQALRLPFALASCYLQVQGNEPSITNFDEDVDQDGFFEGCVDYIWCDSSFRPVVVLQEPAREILLEHTAIPSKIFPSDHIPIYCELILT